MGFKIMLNFDSEIINSIKNLNGQELRYIDSDFILFMVPMKVFYMGLEFQ